MANNSSTSSYMSSNWVMLILALWLFISPWVIGQNEVAGTAMVGADPWNWNFWIVAIVMGGLAIAALNRVAQWEDWIGLALSAWLFFSPWIMNYYALTNAAWDGYIVGLLGAIISICGIVSARLSETGPPSSAALR